MWMKNTILLIGILLSSSWGSKHSYLRAQQKAQLLRATKGSNMPDPNENAPWPRIAWLMSYPKSGASYTLALTENATMTTAASTYGQNHPVDAKGNSIPVHDYSPNGPFWTNSTSDKPKEGQYVLTKTHCGGRCHDCGPSEYITTQHAFLEQCATGSRIKKHAHENVMYDPTIVSRAVHLYRNPFDNVVSRYQYVLKDLAEKNKTEKFSKYSNGREGFQLFCKEKMGDRFYKEAVDSELIDDSLLEDIKIVPCYHDLIRYTQWHNFATMTAKSLHLPTLILHHEDYATEFDGTHSSVLNFLGFDNGAFGDGESGLLQIAEENSYDMSAYFTESEIEAAKRSMEELAFPNIWKEIEHYFPN